MTSRQLLDALTLLPDDLILETDRRRNAPPQLISLRRCLSVAACLVLVLSSVLFLTRLTQPKGATETAVYDAAEAPAALSPEAAVEEAPAEKCAPMEQGPAAGSAMGSLENRNSVTSGATDFPALRLQTPRKTGGTASYSSTPRVTLVRSPEELRDYITHYDYQYHFENMEAAIAGFDSLWFEDHDLLLLAIHLVPTTGSCEITSFAESNGALEIHVAHDAVVPEGPVTTDYHFLLTLEKEQIPSKDAVNLILDIQSQ